MQIERIFVTKNENKKGVAEKFEATDSCIVARTAAGGGGCGPPELVAAICRRVRRTSDYFALPEERGGNHGGETDEGRRTPAARAEIARAELCRVLVERADCGGELVIRGKFCRPRRTDRFGQR